MAWKMPLKDIAIKFELSDDTISRIFIKLKIKKPPRGFWNKKRNT